MAARPRATTSPLAHELDLIERLDSMCSRTRRMNPQPENGLEQRDRPLGDVLDRAERIHADELPAPVVELDERTGLQG